ncbi:MAG: preprotein translocase subunit SecE [Actinobacteria bacterium]|nr:preprotein translocase subunit SecE [Actinomycetota bacterium]
MALNREQKRMLQRQGELGPDGEPLRTRRNPQNRAQNERTGPAQFAREVRSELRKVAWPTRSETINYSIITVVTLVVFTALIFGLDWLFSELVLKLFNA